MSREAEVRGSQAKPSYLHYNSRAGQQKAAASGCGIERTLAYYSRAEQRSQTGQVSFFRCYSNVACMLSSFFLPLTVPSPLSLGILPWSGSTILPRFVSFKES
jgi:hypothetical protein